VLELETAQISLAATRDKLNSKSKALDFQVIRADEAVLWLKNAESRLKATKEDLKNQRQLLESARKTSSKSEISFNMMISSVVAHAAALFKNHLPDLNVELLHQDFTVNDVERETLVSNTFDATQNLVSSYDFTSLFVLHHSSHFCQIIGHLIIVAVVLFLYLFDHELRVSPDEKSLNTELLG
jgi:hypothetical protein